MSEPKIISNESIGGKWGPSTTTTTSTHTGALRFDTGKPELHHIHPSAWHTIVASNSDKLPQIILFLDQGFNKFFYYNNNELNQYWSKVSKDDILEMTKVLEFGAKKYASLNYAKGMKYSRVLNSFRRHILKMIGGEEVDDESGISHLGHILCNYMFIVTYAHTQPEGNDDRVIL